MGFLEKWEDMYYAPTIIILMFLFLGAPYIKPLGLPVPVGQGTITMFRDIDALEPGSNVLLIGPPSASFYGEVGYGFEAFLSHLMRKDLNAFILPLGSAGSAMYPYALDRIKKEMVNKEYGKDYVNMGFIISVETEMAILAENFREWTEKDFYGTPINDIPMLNGINDINDFDAIIGCYTGTIQMEATVRQLGPSFMKGTIYIVTSGNLGPFTKAYVPIPFKAALISLRGAAEYEYLLKRPSRALISMDAQSMMMLLFVLLAIGGNISGYILHSRAQKRGGL